MSGKLRGVKQLIEKLALALGVRSARAILSMIPEAERETIFINVLEEKTNAFATYHLRPKGSERFGLWSDPIRTLPKIGIVVQGPIIKEDDFTLETLKIYKKTMSDIPIILSTWDDEDVSYVNRIKSEGVFILLNKKPEYPGPQNINYQIVSSRNGILKAKELDAGYVLKTRTDQRMCAPNVAGFLVNVLCMFPPAGGFRQKKRILGVSLNTFKYRPYGVSDMTIFGDIDDVLLYYSADLDMRRFGVEERAFLTSSVRNFAKLNICEIYLATEYLKKTGRQLLWTLEDSWSAFSEQFVIVDKESLDLFWFKYSREKEFRYLRYDGVRTDHEMTFREWLNLYGEAANKQAVPEYALDADFGERVALI